MKVDMKTFRPWRVTAQLTAFSLAALLAGGVEAALYRWVDAQGRVHYGDTLPDTYQKSGATEMSKQGRVVKRTQSEAERRAEAGRRAAEAKEARAASDRARQDKALLASYTSVEEIDLARDRALDHHRLAIESAETRAREVGHTLSELNVRKKQIEKSGRPAPAPVVAQLRQSTLELGELKREIRAQEEAMLKVRDKYAQDRVRFRELSAATE